MNKTFVGSRHGKLVIIEIVSGKLCKALCDCGTEKIFKRNNLIRSTVSCGCYKRSGIPQSKNPAFKKAPGISARNTLLLGYKEGAKCRGLSWNLSEEDFDRLTKSNCHYCGIEPYREAKTQTNNGVYIYNGIDRVDNTRGYELNNCVSCCKVCNRAKDVMTVQEFIDWVNRVYKHYNSKVLVAANAA